MSIGTNPLSRILKPTALALATFIALFIGCEPPPMPLAVNEAKGVLDAAAEAGAQDLAPQLFQEAQSYYRQAMEAYDNWDAEEAQKFAVLAHTKALSAASRARTLKMKSEIEDANDRIMRAIAEKEAADAQTEKFQLQVSRMERILRAERENEQKDAEVAVRDAKDSVLLAKERMADQFAQSVYDEAVGFYKNADEALRNEIWAEAIELSKKAQKAAEKAAKLAEPDYKKWKVKEDQKARNDEVFDKVSRIEQIEAKRKKDSIVLILWNLFQTGSEEVDAAMLYKLDTISQVLTTYPMYQVVIEGHTDNTGSKAINLALSIARAQSVKDYFINKKNLPSSRFTATGYGSARPLSSNDDPKGRRKNRRVEIVLLYPE